MSAFFQLEICHCSALARFLSVLPVISAMICVVSDESDRKNAARPSSWLSCARCAPQRVEGAHRQAPWRRAAISLEMRSSISLAALLVKVIAAMLCGLKPHFTR